MKIIICLTIFLVQFAFSATFELSRDIFNNKNLAFIPHQGNGPFDTYLTMEIQFRPVYKLFEQIQKSEGVSLKNRGEAHITVITPVEYFQVLAPKISMSEINQIALRHSIQSSSFEIVCLGRGRVDLKGKKAETYYIVVKSENLVKIRQEIEKLFLARGGEKAGFKSRKYYPHITVGFTERDLHESDGVIKDDSSCIGSISVTDH